MKKTESNLIILNVIFVVSIVVANIVGCKVIDTGLSLFGIPLSTSGGAITYAFTFLCTDIIGEIWGKEEANKAVWRGFFAQLFAIVLIILTQYTPTNDVVIQDAYEKLLGQSPFFVLGSLCAYLTSQTLDVKTFHKIRGYFHAVASKRWIWNNASTISSQLIDTIIYTLVSFGIGLGWIWDSSKYPMMVSIIVGQYLLKVCLAIFDTPLFYYFTKRK